MMFSHCLYCRINATSMTTSSFYSAPVVSHCLYYRIKLGKGMSCFLVKKFVMDFG